MPYALFVNGNSAFNIKNGSAMLNEKAKQKRIEKGDRYHVDYFQKNKDRVNEYQKKRKTSRKF